MLLYGDSEGNAIIIGGGNIVEKKGDYLLSTNFYPARTKKQDIDCWRYLKAEKMLKEIKNISYDSIRSILDAVHVKGTQYSIVYDLKEKIFQVYHYHNFKNGLTFNLVEELKKGKKAYDISSLFPENPEFKKRYRILEKITPENSKVMKILLFILGFCLLTTPVVLIILRRKKSTDQKSNWNFFSTMQVLLSLASVLLLINLLAFFKFSRIFYWGLPISLKGLPPIRIILLHFPLIVILLLLFLAVILINAFKKKLWRKSIRYYSLIKTSLIFLIILIFWYWDFIRLYT